MIKKDCPLTTLVFDTRDPVPVDGNLYAYLVNGLGDSNQGYEEVWCFYYALNRTAASIWMLIALAAASLVGLAVGFGTRDGKLGMGVGGGILGVLMCVHGAAVVGTKH
jgi:hypothetical protein